MLDNVVEQEKGEGVLERKRSGKLVAERFLQCLKIIDAP